MKLTGIKIGDHYLHPLSVKQGADDQLKSSQKQVDKQFNPDWLKTKEHYEEIIRDMVKEHSELVREIKREIELAMVVETCSDPELRFATPHYKLGVADWKALWRKFGVK